MEKTYFDRYGARLLKELFESTLYFFYNEEMERMPLWRLLSPRVCRVRLPNGFLMGTYRYKDIPVVGTSSEAEKLVEQTKRISVFRGP